MCLYITWNKIGTKPAIAIHILQFVGNCMEMHGKKFKPNLHKQSMLEVGTMSDLHTMHGIIETISVATVKRIQFEPSHDYNSDFQTRVCC